MLGSKAEERTKYEKEIRYKEQLVADLKRTGPSYQIAVHQAKIQSMKNDCKDW